MMNTEHVINLLDERPLAALSEPERAIVEAHTKECAACLQAYQAAVIATVLLQERAVEVVEPTPFFKTRVMAALRERQADLPFSFAAMWRAARAMVASMITVVMILVALNFYFGSSGITSAPEQVAASDTLYSAESVILGNGADDLTDSEVLTALYDSPGRYGQSK
jgi:hypothetical protein